MTVEAFEEMCAPLMLQVKETLQTVLQKAQLKPCDVKIVERVGGASRTPAILQVIRKVFKLEGSLRQPKRYGLGSASDDTTCTHGQT